MGMLGGHRERERMNVQDGSSVFHPIISEVTHHHVCHILLVTGAKPSTMGGELTGATLELPGPS